MKPVGACIARPQVARGLILFFIHRTYGFTFSLYRKIYGFALAKQVISSPEEFFARKCNLN